MYVYCVYTAMLKAPKQLSNCLKRAETRVVLVIFDDVLCKVHTFTVTVPQRCST